LLKYLSFEEKKNSQKFKMAPILKMEILLAPFLGALIFVGNFKMLNFLDILKEKTQKKKIKKIVA
jgi:hypothetical protein